MLNLYRGVYFCAVACLLFAFPFTALAQLNSASIYGTVLDSGGAVIPNASVRAVDVSTGSIYRFTTDSLRNFDFPQVRLGAYQVEVEAPGFQKLVRTGINLELGQRAKLDMVLQVGNLTESVQVNSEAPLLETA